MHSKTPRLQRNLGIYTQKFIRIQARSKKGKAAIVVHFLTMHIRLDLATENDRSKFREKPVWVAYENFTYFQTMAGEP